MILSPVDSLQTGETNERNNKTIKPTRETLGRRERQGDIRGTKEKGKRKGKRGEGRGDRGERDRHTYFQFAKTLKMSIIQKNIRYPSACRAPPKCPFEQPIIGGWQTYHRLEKNILYT